MTRSEQLRTRQPNQNELGHSSMCSVEDKTFSWPFLDVILFLKIQSPQPKTLQAKDLLCLLLFMFIIYYVMTFTSQASCHQFNSRLLMQNVSKMFLGPHGGGSAILPAPLMHPCCAHAHQHTAQVPPCCKLNLACLCCRVARRRLCRRRTTPCVLICGVLISLRATATLTCRHIRPAPSPSHTHLLLLRPSHQMQI